MGRRNVKNVVNFVVNTVLCLLGNLLEQSLAHFGSNLQKKMCQITQPWALSTKKKDAQGCDLAPFFGNLSQSEKLYEIKPSLSCF